MIGQSGSARHEEQQAGVGERGGGLGHQASGLGLSSPCVYGNVEPHATPVPVVPTLT